MSVGVEVVMALEGDVEIASSETWAVGLGMVGRERGEWWKEFFSIPGWRLVSGWVAKRVEMAVHL